MSTPPVGPPLPSGPPSLEMFPGIRGHQIPMTSDAVPRAEGLSRRHESIEFDPTGKEVAERITDYTSVEYVHPPGTVTPPRNPVEEAEAKARTFRADMKMFWEVRESVSRRRLARQPQDVNAGDGKVGVRPGWEMLTDQRQRAAIREEIIGGGRDAKIYEEIANAAKRRNMVVWNGPRQQPLIDAGVTPEGIPIAKIDALARLVDMSLNGYEDRAGKRVSAEDVRNYIRRSESLINDQEELVIPQYRDRVNKIGWKVGALVAARLGLTEDHKLTDKDARKSQRKANIKSAITLGSKHSTPDSMADRRDAATTGEVKKGKRVVARAIGGVVTASAITVGLLVATSGGEGADKSLAPQAGIEAQDNDGRIAAQARLTPEQAVAQLMAERATAAQADHLQDAA